MPEQGLSYVTDESRMAREYVDAWLMRDGWTLNEWLDDFTGMNLPPLPPEEPYLWILEGLGTGTERQSRENRLALRLARVLDSEPDRDVGDQRRRQALYNALTLCSEIRVPDVLAAPLWRMLDRASLPDIRFGYNLRLALRQALMMNPPGREREPLWVAMAKGEKHSFLPSDRYDAFYGILLLPPDDKGEYPVDSMSEVLGALAAALEGDEPDESERGRRLREMLKRVWDCWLGERYMTRLWHDAFVDWPACTAACIAELFGLSRIELAEVQYCRSQLDNAFPSEKVRWEHFNTTTRFVEQRAFSHRLAQALADERAHWRGQAGVPVAAYA